MPLCNCIHTDGCPQAALKLILGHMWGTLKISHNIYCYGCLYGFLDTACQIPTCGRKKSFLRVSAFDSLSQESVERINFLHLVHLIHLVLHLIHLALHSNDFSTATESHSITAELFSCLTYKGGELEITLAKKTFP